MVRSLMRRCAVIGITAALLALPGIASADHSWDNYHWARTSNPFTLQLGDNVDSTWDSVLGTTSADWSESTVLDTAIVPGGTKPRNCRATSGRVEVCNAKYGRNGWLGIATIWVSGSHITQGTAKVNDTYFSTPPYNTSAWRNLVMCQEVAHTFGLDHQDENRDNPNVGSCMDYTNDPDGPPSNEHPNAHDYQQLELIYEHADGFTTVGSASAGPAQGVGNARSDWGREIRTSSDGRVSLFVLQTGTSQQVFTFVIWVGRH
jgi:hypothetical protein